MTLEEGIRELKIKTTKKLLKHFRSRKTLLEKYRDIDINTEILDCLNEINKLKKQLEDLKNEEKEEIKDESKN